MKRKEGKLNRTVGALVFLNAQRRRNVLDSPHASRVDDAAQMTDDILSHCRLHRLHSLEALADGTHVSDAAGKADYDARLFFSESFFLYCAEIDKGR